ncbi:hypothetical protein RFF05_12115 [Bengtsoniella intestinalis]|uniref:hypothetical protein n=1 Tax=Bengtsoniella intestinalis TaxID=3073143 RepID=UPI00391F2DB5
MSEEVDAFKLEVSTSSACQRTLLGGARLATHGVFFDKPEMVDTFKLEVSTIFV